MDTKQTNKEHRGGSTRTTAKKKLHQNGQNRKAFAVNAPKKLERMARRTADKNERKYHVPMVDRTPDDDPPPVIVAVVGPPGTGKTTLIKSLIRRLAKVTINEIKGPITIVSGKRRRLTFIEVGKDLNSMIDAAKIADLVLLMVDGNYGLEMETMEFLNIAQHHGMPKVLGCATHLDLFKSQSTLKTSKKRLKHRFWTEVYLGAKLFYLSGVINGRYPDREILNLTRFISVMKFRPLKWRNEHPYLLADRVTDLTHPQDIADNSKCDRKVAIYGYLHGTPLPSQNAHMHIAGMGDHFVHSIEKLPDPCPTPYYELKIEELERERAKAAAESGEPLAKTTRRRKRLEDRQKIIYAPMSDVGGVLVDKDAVYIDVGEKESFVPGEEMGEGEKLVTDLQEVPETMREKLASAPGLQLFSSSSAIKDVDEENGDDEDISDTDAELSDDETDQLGLGDKGRKVMRSARVYGKALNDDDEFDGIIAQEDDDTDDNESENGEPNLVEVDFDKSGRYNDDELEFVEDSALSSDEDDYTTTAANLRGLIRRKWDLNKLLYLRNILPSQVLDRWNASYDEREEDIEADDEEFFKKAAADDNNNDLDTFVPLYPSTEDLKTVFNATAEADDAAGNGYSILKARFLIAPKVNGVNSSENVDEGGDEDNDDDLFGDFEDLELAENSTSTLAANTESKDDFADFDAEEEEDEGADGGNDNEDDNNDPNPSIEARRKLNAAKKAKLKVQFEDEEDREFGAEDPLGDNEAETWYEFQKNKMAKQLEINKSEFEDMDAATRVKIEGYRAGSYVKIVFEKLPCEFIENLEPQYPIVLGGLLPTESRFGIMNVRIRRHRWHKKILKSLDPLILSLGWRRFQTLPIYTTSDSRTRNRMLKYTPEHAYCFASFYGPLVAPNTTFVGFNIIDNKSTTGSFRVAATGIVEDLNSSVEIVKKLKLVGHPCKIFRNTAFVKDMFSNALEVAKFEGASIRTVSGIRGEIKRALSKPEGHFRATFEDKVLMSDTIFLKTWYPVKVKKFYNPVTSLLLREHTEWKGMRLTGQVRAENNLETPLNADSAYSKIERAERRFNPLKVPKSIKASLPFKSQIHAMAPQKKKLYMAARAVVLDEEEKKARQLMQKLTTVRKEKDSKRKSKKEEKSVDKLKALAKKEEMRKEKERERKKDYFQKEGKKRGGGAGAGSNKRQRT